MPIATRTFRVFVSSTFEDLKAERDALQREVFPRLRKLCEANNARFQAIDLRWGVRDEAALDQQTMEICLREIARCQQTGIKPNFIVLLGERYGWRPLPARIEAGEFNKVRDRAADADKQLIDDWYERDDNAVPPEFLLKARTGEFADKDCWGEVEQRLHRILREAAREAGLPEESLIKYEASATHQEILKGLGQSEEERQHVFAFLREAAKGAREDEELAALKQKLREKLPEGNVCPFSASDLARLCADVEAKLSAVILAEAGRFTSRDALEVEIEAHNLFAQDRSKVFYGRKNALDAIDQYIRGTERRALVLHGTSGSGKSAVMAKASEQFTGPERVIRRFIGASPESASGHALLTSLCKQIAPGETPADYAKLENTFRERLSTAAAEQPLVLFIDALDQLSVSDPARGATWLPAELPPHVKVIVSTTDDGERLPQGLPVALERMTTAEGGQALDELLRGTDPKEQRRTLQPWQRDLVLEHFERCGLPLYLKLAAEESRLWKSYSPPDACGLGEGIAGVLDTLFDRLASNANHGPVLVERSLGYLAAARYGLMEDEMLDVLAADDVVWDDFDNKKHHEVSERRLPVVVWSRLSLDLEPYLTERAAPGGTVIAFYHRQLVERVEAKFLAGGEAQTRHRDLAGYFLAKPAWLDEGHKSPNARRAAELVFQQRNARQWKEAEATLFDCPFLFAKCAAGLVLDLEDDYRALLRDAPESELTRRDDLRLVQGTLRLSLHVVAKDASQFASQMWGRLLSSRDKPGIAAFLENLDACTPRPRLWPVLEAAGGPIPRVLKDNADSVNAMARSVDSKRAVSGSDNMTLWPVLEAAGGPTLRILNDHAVGVNAVALSADGRRAVSGSDDMTVRVWDLESNRPPRVLAGHTGSVRAVAISADGKRAVSGADDHTLRVWDLKGNQVPRVLDGHTSIVGAVALSSDGKRAVSGGWDDDPTVWVWDLDGNNPPRILKGHTSRINAVALSADGKRAVSGSMDNTVRVWDLESNQPPRVSVKLFWPLSLLYHFLEDRNSGSGGRFERRLWNRPPRLSVRLFWPFSLLLHFLESKVSNSEGRFKRRLSSLVWADRSRILKSHTGSVDAVALSATGKRAISGSTWDGTLRVWDLEGNRPPRILKEPPHSVLSLALSANGKRAVSGSSDRTVRVWDLESDQPPRVLEGHTGAVKAVALSSDGKRAITGSGNFFGGSGDNTLRIWDLEDNQLLRFHEDHLNVVAVSDDGRRSVSRSNNNTLWAWDDLEGNQPAHLHEEHLNAIALSANGKRAISRSNNGTLWVWDLECICPPSILKFRPNGVYAVALSADGNRAVFSSNEDTLQVCDLEDNRLPRLLIDHHMDLINRRKISCQSLVVALSGDSRRAISGSDDSIVRVWDLQGDHPPHVLEGHTGPVKAVVLSGDGQRAVSSSLDRTVRVWDLEGNQPPRILEGHADQVHALAMTSDGQRAVSSACDFTLRVWDLEGDQPPRVLKGHTGSVSAVALSGDGSRSVSGSGDHTLRVWDLESGKCLALFTCDATVNCCAWASERNRIVAGDYLGHVHLFAWEE